MNTDSIEGVVPYHTHTHIYICILRFVCVDLVHMCVFAMHVRKACRQFLPRVALEPEENVCVSGRARNSERLFQWSSVACGTNWDAILDSAA